MILCLSASTDGDRAIGVQFRDPTEYHTLGPYEGIYGENGFTTLENAHSMKSLEPKSNYNFSGGEEQRWPQSFTVKLKPNPKPNNSVQAYAWGMCTSACKGGISLSYIYPYHLQVNKGLSLVLFRNKTSEKYTINMIEVSVIKDSP